MERRGGIGGTEFGTEGTARKGEQDSLNSLKLEEAWFGDLRTSRIRSASGGADRS